MSNVNTATYRLACYLSKMLSPLTLSKNTLESITNFVNIEKQQTISSTYKLVLFDIKSSFTDLLLDTEMDIILKRIYDNYEVTNSIEHKEVKDLITPCSKNVFFTFISNIYQQRDCVAMRSRFNKETA